MLTTSRHDGNRNGLDAADAADAAAAATQKYATHFSTFKRLINSNFKSP